MFRDGRLNEGGCCSPSIRGLRRLTFPDGTQVGITGLDAVMENLYREGRPADAATAAEIIERLKSENYFEPSARPAYEALFLKEYRRLVERRAELAENPANARAGNPQGKKAGKQSILGRLKSGKRPDEVKHS